MVASTSFQFQDNTTLEVALTEHKAIQADVIHLQSWIPGGSESRGTMVSLNLNLSRYQLDCLYQAIGAYLQDQEAAPEPDSDPPLCAECGGLIYSSRGTNLCAACSTPQEIDLQKYDWMESEA